MASEIRVNRLSNRSGLSTITFANGGVQFSGITTFANGDFRVGTGATILNPSANEMQFHTGGSNRFTINNSGANLGTGNITAVDATFSGNVSIGKTLTYEDVKNVDSVGVVTARTGVKVTGGDFTVGTAITASSVTGNVTQDVGITTFSGSATWFKGTTANKDMYWSKSSGSVIFKDTAAAIFGNSSDLQISHNGTHSQIKNATGDLQIWGDHIDFWSGDGQERIFESTKDGAVNLYFNASKKFETRSGGVTVTGGINLSGELLNNDHIQIQADNKHLIIGVGDDLRAYHNGTNSVVNNNTGKLIVTSDDIWLKDKDDGDVHAKFIHDGAVELYHDNVKKLETISSGAAVTGNLGINQTSPNARIEITDTSTAQIRLGYNQSKYVRIGRNSSGHYEFFSQENGAPLVFGTAASADGGGAEKMRIDRYGKVGIATDNPYAPLSLRTSAESSSSGNLADNGILLHAPGATDEHVIPISASFVTHAYLPRCGIGFISHPTVDPIQGYAGEIGFYTHDAADGSGLTRSHERMRITRSGKVGIGIAAPTEALDVNGNFRIGDGNAGRHITFSRSGLGNALWFAVDGHEWSSNNVATISSGTTQPLVLGANGAERLRISADGKLFVGTTAAVGAESWLFRKDAAGGADGCRLTIYNASNNSVNNQARLSLRTVHSETTFASYNQGEIYISNSNTSAYFMLYLGGVNRFRVKNNGQIQLRKDSDCLRLLPTTSGNAVYIEFYDDGDSQRQGFMGFGSNTETTSTMHIHNSMNGQLEFRTNNTVHFRINNNGDLQGTDTSISSLSDIRLKKNVADFVYDLSKFKQFKPKTFEWINTDKHNSGTQRGFIAQDLEGVDAELTGETSLDEELQASDIATLGGSDKAKTARLGKNDTMYISVIQQLIDKIETLEAEVADLKSS